ncbi:MAG: peroxiredoxin [Oligoflexia bacterium]|nr:peroxiredoxin [Oligoflexia bacterium]
MSVKLKAGDLAPSFTLKSQDGRTYSLSDYKGRWVVLYFYPKDDTPGCTKQACSFRDNFESYKKMGIQVFGISVDDETSHDAFAKKFHLQFPLLADTEKKTSKAYGAFSNEKYSDRFTFVIKPDQTIGHIFEKVNVEAHASEVMEAIEKAK